MKSAILTATVLIALAGAYAPTGLSFGETQLDRVSGSLATEVAQSRSADRADIKANYLVGALQKETFTLDGVTVEIDRVEKIDNGIQIFARAWNEKGTQFGFGADGTTDLERFRIFNPPILVEDAAGSITRASVRNDGTVKTERFREDPLLAIRKTLVHTILVSGRTDTQIVPGSVGNTTDTFYSNASGDGAITWNNGTFANNRAGTGSLQSIDTSSASQNFYEDTNYSMRGLFYPIDTSSIPSTNVISSATFSLYGAATGLNSPARGVGLLQSSQASLTALVQADWVPPSYTEVATRKNIADLSTGTYNDYTITDLSIIAKGSGFTKLMILGGPIIDNDSVSGSWYFNFYSADQTGTANDPKLVVVHAAAPAAAGTDSIIYFD